MVVKSSVSVSLDPFRSELIKHRTKCMISKDGELSNSNFLSSVIKLSTAGMYTLRIIMCEFILYSD